MVRQLVHTNNIGFNTHASGKTQLTFSLTTGEIPVSLTGKQYVRYEYNKSIGKKSMKVLISHRQARKLGGYLYGDSTKGGALLGRRIANLPSWMVKVNPALEGILGKVQTALNKTDIPSLHNISAPTAVNAFLDLKKAQEQQTKGGGLTQAHRARIKSYTQVYGKGFWQDVGNFFTKTIPSVAKTIWDNGGKEIVTNGAKALVEGGIKSMMNGGAIRKRKAKKKNFVGGSIVI